MHTGDPTLDHEYKMHAMQQIPELVENYLKGFQRAIATNDIHEIETHYEIGWNHLSERFYTSDSWPSPDSVRALVGNDDMFLILYKELYYRHIYAKSQGGPTQNERLYSYYNYCDLFNNILSATGPVALELPNQWLYDIIDEFIYQFQAYTQYKCKLVKKSSEEIDVIRNNPKIWNIHSVLNVLHSLVEKSKINEQLKAYNEGESQQAIAQIAGEFGISSLYKMLGYFSLIGLLRLHSLLGDYHQALAVLEHININKGSNVYSRVPECQMTTYYYVGFGYMMMHKYHDAIKTFSSILIYIQRSKNAPHRSSQYKLDMMNKQTDQMLYLLALCHSFYPVRIDEVLIQVMKERVPIEKLQRLQKGDKQIIEEMFVFGCPKFLSPVPPNFDATHLNSHKEPTIHQCKVFLEDVDQQIQLPIIRSYLKLYSTMSVAKLAAFLEMKEEDFIPQLMCLKAKMMNARSSSSEEESLEVDFYIDDGMIHIANTKVERSPADYFIKQILKFKELNNQIQALK